MSDPTQSRANEFVGSLIRWAEVFGWFVFGFGWLLIIWVWVAMRTQIPDWVDKTETRLFLDLLPWSLVAPGVMIFGLGVAVVAREMQFTRQRLKARDLAWRVLAARQERRSRYK